MKSFLIATIFCLVFCGNGTAQQAVAGAPAAKEDVERYLQALQSHDMMNKMMEAMSKPMHQMVHDDYLKDKDKLPADFEERTNKMIDGMLKDMPWDQMLQAMVPVYQKHFTKGDLDALVGFYSSPTGQKVLHEMPGVMADAMESIMPIMRKHLETVQQSVQQQVAEMLKESQKKPGQDPPAARN